MSSLIPSEVDAIGFEARLKDCSDSLRELVTHLQASSQNAGPRVTARRYRHPEPNSGWGVTYYTDRAASFCEIHPKLKEEHTWVRLPGVDAATVARAGFEPSKQEGWLKIRTMEEAVRLVHWILQSHDARTSYAG